MSFFTELHTFGSWVEGELKKLEGKQPEIAAVTDSILTYVGGAAAIIAGAEGGPGASAAVTAAVGAIKTGSTALSGLIADFGANPTVASIASSFATNASSLLAAAQVKSPTSQKAATAIITNLTGLATALTTASTPAASTSANTTAPVAPVAAVVAPVAAAPATA